MPVVVDAVDRLGQRLRDLDPVTIVVVHDVLPPVRRRPRESIAEARATLRVAVVPVHLAVAPVRLAHRIDERDYALADLAHRGLIGDGESVCELHHHLRRSHLGRVESGVQVVDRLRGADRGVDLGGRNAPRIGEPRGGRLVAVQVANRCLVGDRDEQDLPPLLRRADRLDADARRRGGECAEVAVDLRSPMHHAPRADDRAEMPPRARHGRTGRQRRDGRRQESRIRRRLADEPRVGSVEAVSGLRGRGTPREREQGDNKHTARSGPEHRRLRDGTMGT
jgi:hypothetical protein